MEIWKDIKGHEGLYKVSSHGRVKSLVRESVSKERIKHKYLTKFGYHTVNLYKKNKGHTILVHKLVAIAFLNYNPDLKNGLVIDHINNIKIDNRASNLQLITQRLNVSKDKNKVSSKYTGVSWNAKRNRWKAGIKIKGKSKFLGRFKDEYKAHLAYQKALKEIQK